MTSVPAVESALRIVSAVVVLAGSAGSLGAQVRPDTSEVPDTLAFRADSLPPDSALAPQADTTAAPDTIFYNLPRLGGEVPAGWATGVWEWDHEAILESGASSLVELVDEVPGVVPLLGGDFGTPEMLSAFGVGGGRVRVFRDGFELTPLDGSIPDLARVGLGGVHRVRLERQAGELVVEVETLRYAHGESTSWIEAGTGDLDSNLFRGSFADPTSLGGSVAVALERSDTRGPGGNETGNRSGSWLRYQLHRGNDAGLALDFRRMGTETEVSDYPAGATRTDWALRGRARLAPGLVGEAYWGNSKLKTDDARDDFARVGGSRSQWGLRLAYQRGPLWLRAARRSFGGDALPAVRTDLAAGLQDVAVGGVAAEYGRATWDGTTTSNRRVRAWTRPLGGLSLFASRESGTMGARTGPLLLPPEPEPEPDSVGGEPVPEPDPDTLPPDPLFHVSDRTATRYGAVFRWRSVVLSGARLKVEADTLLPFALIPDRAGTPVAGGERSGWEVFARVPTILDGLRVEGSLQQWDESWSYLPERIYRGAFVYHGTYRPTGNAELWVTLGVRGRDPMSLRFLGSEENDEGDPLPATVPFFQSWYARIQFRVVSVRLFVGWDNFTVRRNLQDFPGRVLPITRAFYGVRWSMRN